MTEQPVLGLTEIPQDIKLELNNGTLTLKSGSVITSPDGTQRQTTADLTTTASHSGKLLILVTPSGTALTNNSFVEKCCSGTTDSLASTPYHFWFDTANTVINYYGSDGSTVSGTRTLPIALVTVSNGAISSIDQVFNGFGYMGSSAFVLPNVSGFSPNGYKDLKLKFSYKKTNALHIYNITSVRINTVFVFNSSYINPWSGGLEIVNKLSDIKNPVNWRRYYNKFDNFIYSFNTYNFVKDDGIAFGYITTENTAPYRITSFNIVNPFLTINFLDVSDYGRYLAKLLIIQYNSKPKSTMTINSVGKMFPDDTVFSVRDGFNINTATGKQLDILAKYIGAERGYTDSNNQKAVLTDEEFRVLLKLKIIVNNGTATLYGLETSLYNLFGTGIRVVETKDENGNPNMGLTYYIRSDWANVGLAAVQQNILPHPTGVGYTYNLAALTKYFGFIEYTDLSHPFTTGFRDYNDPTKAGEMYSYDKVIPQ